MRVMDWGWKRNLIKIVFIRLLAYIIFLPFLRYLLACIDMAGTCYTGWLVIVGECGIPYRAVNTI
jgi:hypothetical protein